MTPYLEANRAVLDELYDNVIAFLRSLDEDCLNWRPLASDTNSIAAMVTHTAGSIANWLGRALGEVPTRDRDAEFRARASAGDLIALLEESRANARRQLARLDNANPTMTISVHRLSSGTDATVSVAWCVEHAVIHAGEHWGQIQLTGQLYAAR
jgi:uncharacterized damage-inducible protein DinB